MRKWGVVEVRAGPLRFWDGAGPQGYSLFLEWDPKIDSVLKKKLA